MTFWIFIYLIVAGIFGGLLASIAGLASLVSYPACSLIDIPPVVANVTNTDRKSTRLNSSHITRSRMPSSA